VPFPCKLKVYGVSLKYTVLLDQETFHLHVYKTKTLKHIKHIPMATYPILVTLKYDTLITSSNSNTLVFVDLKKNKIVKHVFP
jgi:hypothetical protein